MTNPNESSSSNPSKKTSQDPEKPTPTPPSPPRPQAENRSAAAGAAAPAAPAGNAPPARASRPPPPPPPPAPPAAKAARRAGEGGSASAARQTAAAREQAAGMALVPVGGGIQVGGAGGGSSGAVGLPARPPQKRKSSEIVAPEGFAPICSVCNRRFGSWKALFGHMRSHPERQWRGCFPPPMFGAHGGAARPLLGPPRPGGQASSAAGGSSSAAQARAGLDIDLNQPQEEEISAAAGDAPEEKDGGIDLNKPPAKDDRE